MGVSGVSEILSRPYNWIHKNSADFLSGSGPGYSGVHMLRLHRSVTHRHIMARGLVANVSLLFGWLVGLIWFLVVVCFRRAEAQIGVWHSPIILALGNWGRRSSRSIYQVPIQQGSHRESLYPQQTKVKEKDKCRRSHWQPPPLPFLFSCHLTSCSIARTRLNVVLSQGK